MKLLCAEYTEVRDPDDDGVEQFHDNVLVEAFPDPYAREDVSILRRNLREGSWTDRNEVCRYHLIVARCGVQVVGGVSFYFFSFGDHALGMGSYLAVEKDFSGNGIGTELIEIRDRILLKDAREFNCYLKGTVIQVNDPSLMSLEEIRRDSMDPWAREKFWKRRGYRKVAFRFIQPSIRAGEPPVEYLSLHIFPHCPQWGNMQYISKAEMQDIVYCFIRCTGTLGPPESDPSYLIMKQELAGQEHFRVY